MKKTVIVKFASELADYEVSQFRSKLGLNIVASSFGINDIHTDFKRDEISSTFKLKVNPDVLKTRESIFQLEAIVKESARCVSSAEYLGIEF